MPLDMSREVSLMRMIGALIGIVVFFVMGSPTLANEIYFISQGVGPRAMPDNRPLPCTIYLLDEDQKALVPVWSLPGDTTSNAVAVYSSLGTVAIGEGDMPNQFHVISLRCDDQTQMDMRKKLRRMGGPWSLAANANMTRVSFWCRNSSRENQVFHQLSLDSSSVDAAEKSADTSAIRLAGLAPEYSASQGDCIRFPQPANGQFQHSNPQYKSLVPRVPEGLIRTVTTRGWLLIANEETFLALTPIRDRHGLTQREVLIYHQADSTWHSLMVEGSETKLSTINGWLVGVVANTNPKTNIEAHISYAPLVTRRVVFVDPLEQHQFIAELEGLGEVLWITDDEVVYYRCNRSIHRARIQDDDLVERSVAATDFLTDIIHWGFEMGACEE